LFGLYEIIGYAGSFLVAVSLTMKNIVKLRWVNLAGAFTFAVYGFLIEAYPIFAVNFYITVIDIYYIVQMYSKKDSFSFVGVEYKENSYLAEFLKIYWDDIIKYFPDFKKEELHKLSSHFVLRNLNPAGLFVYEELENNKIKVHVDYAIPEYRDLKNAMYLYSTELNLLKQNKISGLIAETSVEEHRKYLMNIGFKQENKTNIYIKTV